MGHTVWDSAHIKKIDQLILSEVLLHGLLGWHPPNLRF